MTFLFPLELPIVLVTLSVTSWALWVGSRVHKGEGLPMFTNDSYKILDLITDIFEGVPSVLGDIIYRPADVGATRRQYGADYE